MLQANSIRQFLLAGRLLDAAIGQSGPQQSASFSARWRAFSDGMRRALEALGQIQMPEWDAMAVKEVCRIKFKYEF